MSKRAILYARVSGDDRNNATSSIEGQLAECRRYAESRGYTVVSEVFEDPTRHTSGAAWLPELDGLLRLAPSRTFDVLIVRELDRLARDLAKQLVVESEFARAGVEIVYVLGDYASTPEGTLMKHVKAVIAEYERFKITERMERGRRAKARAGHVLPHGAPPYGYSYDAIQRMFVIDEGEAAVVRQIFTWYIDEGLSLRAIANRLNEQGVPTSTDSGKGRGNGMSRSRARGTSKWKPTTVRYILANLTYAGQWDYGRYKQKTAPDEVITVIIPAIVSPECITRAGELKQVKKSQAKRNTKHDYLVGRRVRCRECGLAMASSFAPIGGRPYSYYRCRAADRRGEYERQCTQTKQFRADRVDAAVWNWVKSYLSDPTKLAEGFANYQSEHERRMAPLRDRITALERLIADNQEQLDRLLDLYLAGNFPKDMLLERKIRLTDTITALAREREGLADQLAGQCITESDMQAMFTFANEIAKGLDAADGDFETRRHIVELLDVRVALANDEGEQVIYPSCRFTKEQRLSIVSKSLFPLAAPNRRSASGGPASSMVGVAVRVAQWLPRPQC